MSQFSCSFAVHCASACDLSTRYPDRTQFFPLNSCVSDVKAHLRELQTTQSCVASERELILARVGLFYEEGEDIWLFAQSIALYLEQNIVLQESTSIRYMVTVRVKYPEG